jgi:predicted TPR repeat methyltransferase
MTEAGFLRRTRDGYDVTAAAYADRFHDHLDDKPLDRAVLAGFAGLVGRGGGKLVIDLGCGTGATTATLHDFGLDVLGIDLSPRMIDEAQRLNPALTFRVGTMTALDLDGASVDAVCAW